MIYKNIFTYTCLFFAMQTVTLGQSPERRLVDYVDPMIGTAKMGHTYPGSTVPLGAVQLSPATDTISYAVNVSYTPDVYIYCPAYKSDAPTIVGLTHTRFSATVHADLRVFRRMHTSGELKLNPCTADLPGSGYRSLYSLEHDFASANYYSVK